MPKESFLKYFSGFYKNQNVTHVICRTVRVYRIGSFSPIWKILSFKMVPYLGFGPYFVILLFCGTYSGSWNGYDLSGAYGLGTILGLGSRFQARWPFALVQLIDYWNRVPNFYIFQLIP